MMLNIQKYWQNVPSELITIEDSPETLVDGFILDFSSHGIDKSPLPYGERKYPSLPKETAEPIYQASVKLRWDGMGRDGQLSNHLVVDSLTTLRGRKVFVQHRYMEYFRQVYIGCHFYTTRKPYTVVVVKHDGKIVGAVMPVQNRAGYYPFRQEVKTK